MFDLVSLLAGTPTPAPGALTGVQNLGNFLMEVLKIVFGVVMGVSALAAFASRRPMLAATTGLLALATGIWLVAPDFIWGLLQSLVSIYRTGQG